jgi:hypothetical protein
LSFVDNLIRLILLKHKRELKINIGDFADQEKSPMFTATQFYARAARDLFDAQMACLANVVHAFMDGNVNATDRHVDTMNTVLATATVAARQWSVASTGTRWEQPASAGAAACIIALPEPDAPDAGTATRTSPE